MLDKAFKREFALLQQGVHKAIRTAVDDEKHFFTDTRAAIKLKNNHIVGKALGVFMKITVDPFSEL